MHSHRVSNCLGHLMKTIVGTSPVQDPHLEQAKKNWIIDMNLIHLSKPFCPSDHIGPELIIKGEVQVNIPPPAIMDKHFIIWFPWFPNTMEGVLGDLNSLSVFPSRGNKEGNYLIC